MPLPSTVSVYSSPSNVFLVSSWYVLYLLANGRVAICRNFCVVFSEVLEVILKLITHISLKSCGVTSECYSELENMFKAGTSDLPESSWLSCTKTFGTLTSVSDIVTFMESTVWWIRLRSNKKIRIFLLLLMFPEGGNSTQKLHWTKNTMRVLTDLLETNCIWIPVVWWW